MKDIDWGKVEITDEVVEYVKHKYEKYNFMEDNSWSQILLYIKHSSKIKQRQTKKQNLQKGKVNDKEKGKVYDLQNIVDRLEKAKSKLMVSEKGTKKASVDLVDAFDLQNRIKNLSEDFNMLVKAQKTKEAKEAKVVEVSSNEEDFSDEGFFGDEDVVLFNDVKYLLTDTEIRMFKERPTTSRAPIASTSITSRSIVPIASTSNAQAASTAPRGYMKIAMIGCVLGLRAPNDPNALLPSTTRKRKP
ncbi:hypothetical protein Tco_1317645 [Tanacetum coccineum]